MVLEAVAALLVGLFALWIVLQPILLPHDVAPPAYEPPDPSETRRGVALTALKELDFDHATGKISDDDYRLLRERYTAEALAALREEEGEARAPAAAPSSADEPASDARAAASVAEADLEAMIAARVRATAAGAAGAAAGLVCRRHGRRPEADAVFCSECGEPLATGCGSCGAAAPPDARFCERCGTPMAA
jgi:hypothetical protein